MKAYLEKQVYVGPSLCDRSGKLSVPALFTIFGDVATEHAGILKIGVRDLMPKDRFWVTVKTRVEIRERPEMDTTVTLVTWPEKPERMKTYRNYMLLSGGRVLANARTEWAVIELSTGRPVLASSVFPETIEFIEKENEIAPFSRLKDSFEGEKAGEFTVLSPDIDMGHHMNNALYIRALAGLKSNDELEKNPISALEIDYKNQCREGEKITIISSRTDDGKTIAKGVLSDGKTAFICLTE